MFHIMLVKLLITLVSLYGILCDSPYHNPHCQDNRLVLVHMFEWKWPDIAAECENYLGPMGFCGVQVSPPQECAIVRDGHLQTPRPWWERYQPVSYELNSRSGNEAQFVDMIQRCHNAGVNIYVDSIINHMAAVGRVGPGTGGTDFTADDLNFPGVPYTADNFNDCSSCRGCCCVDEWTNFENVRNCRLVGLTDLNQAVPDTRNKIAGYLNYLISLGVAGFRVDAAKHMWPEDMEAIVDMTDNLNTQYFPAGSRPFFVHEVIDMNQHNEIRGQWYSHIGRVTDFRYSYKVMDAVSSLSNIGGVYDPNWGMLPPEDAFVFVDNHDTQRGHGPGGVVHTYKEPHQYKLAQAITMGWNYGYPRILSSFEFTDTEAGPPVVGGTEDILSPIVSGNGCSNEWVCEHRWNVMSGMASFAKAVYGTGINNYWEGGGSVAWSRGNRGFVALTNWGNMDLFLQTGLPAGQYCNVIQGCPTNSGCAGDTIEVFGDGMANIRISGPDPVMAIHVDARSGSGSCISEGGTAPPPGTTTTTAPTPPPTAGVGFSHTIVFIRAVTQFGQDLFVRGGIGHDNRPGCTENAQSSPCALSIVHVAEQTNEGYNAWKVGDNKLDWYGAEAAQGSYNGRRAEGSPAIWTDRSHPNNNFGDHYWMLDIELNCDETENGWFEVKAVILQSGGSVTWEGDVNQSGCQGSAGGTAPYSSGNHMARCGFMNVFEMNSGSCTIDNM